LAGPIVKLLLDTHVLIWWVSDAARLSPDAIRAVSAPDNQVLISVVSVWEMVVKVGLGKLVVNPNVRELIQQQLDQGIGVLPLLLEHVTALETLPNLHKDPFDRALVAQAIAEQAHLVTNDRILHDYPVPTLW
jgi:PIN domain nuclease of toxin-antitoxin system